MQSKFDQIAIFFSTVSDLYLHQLISVCGTFTSFRGPDGITVSESVIEGLVIYLQTSSGTKVIENYVVLLFLHLDITYSS
jgi:hypothetical protein